MEVNEQHPKCIVSGESVTQSHATTQMQAHKAQRQTEAQRQHEACVDSILRNESKGIPSTAMCEWKLDDKQGCFISDSRGARVPYSKFDGGVYLSSRELITRATIPGKLAPVNHRTRHGHLDETLNRSYAVMMTRVSRA